MPNYITIYKNKFKITDNHPDLCSIITINEDLKAGTYEAGLFSKVSQKGNKIYNGTIRLKEPKEKKPVEKAPEKFSAKALVEQALIEQSQTEEAEDEIPF